MSAKGNIKYLNRVKHAELWEDYNGLTDPVAKFRIAEDIVWRVENSVESDLYNQFKRLLQAETIPRVPMEYGAFAIQRLDSENVHIYFYDEDRLLIDYSENIDPDIAFAVFTEMAQARSDLSAALVVKPTHKTRQVRKRERNR